MAEGASLGRWQAGLRARRSIFTALHLRLVQGWCQNVKAQATFRRVMSHPLPRVWREGISPTTMPHPLD